MCVCGGQRAGRCACELGRGQDGVRVWWAEGRTVCVCGGQRAGRCACELGRGQDSVRVCWGEGRTSPMSWARATLGGSGTLP